MSNNVDKYVRLLSKFGLGRDSSRIFLLLLSKGEMTALQISRELKLGRTKVYRLLERLISKGLVNEVIGVRGKRFVVDSYENLKLITIEKEEEVEELKNTLPKLFEILSYISVKDSKHSKVYYYSGMKGLKQMCWNSTKAKGELRIFEIEEMADVFHYGFYEKVRLEYVRKNIFIKQIFNEKVLEPFTNITELLKNHVEFRYIDPRKLDMGFEILIYNDILGMYNYEGDEIIGIEIENARLAKMQKQIFNFLWMYARPIKILDKHGRAEVKRKRVKGRILK